MNKARRTLWTLPAATVPQTLLGITVTGALLSCGCSQSAEGPPENVAPVHEELYFLSAFGKWPNGRVPVCYAPDGNNQALLAEAKTVLADSWGQAANITFVDWGPCVTGCNNPDLPSMVVVHFAAGTRGETSPRGPAPANSGQGRCMPPEYPCCPTPGVTSVTLISNDTDRFHQRFRYEVIHEFGHALGFAHEQERPDNWQQGTPICNKFDNGTMAQPGGTYETPFDYASIMDYCSQEQVLGGYPTFLSSGDILGVRKVYGRNPAAHGFMIGSDRDPSLFVKAWNGAAEGTALALDNACTTSNPDCTWSYQYGMLVSDTDPTLAVNAWYGAAEGTELRLTRQCTRLNPDCTWTWKHGEFISDRDSSLAINALGGAHFGTNLILTKTCSPSNPDCTWHMPNVMLSSARNATLRINAFNGSGDGVPLKLHNGCTVDNPDCTWTFAEGLLESNNGSTLAMNALNGAVNGATVADATTCSPRNPDCTWTWKQGELISDNLSSGPLLPVNAVNGAVFGASLQLNRACTAQNVDCLFSGLFARDR